MKKIKKIVMLSAILVMSVAVMTGCGSKANDEGTTKQSSSETEIKKADEEIEVSVILLKDAKEISNKTITIPQDTNLLDATMGNFEVVEEGGMITAIDGVKQNTEDSYFWTYTINDEMINTGAKDTILSDGDKVVFTYAKF